MFIVIVLALSIGLLFYIRQLMVEGPVLMFFIPILTGVETGIGERWW
jgi:hypothetical protein